MNDFIETLKDATAIGTVFGCMFGAVAMFGDSAEAADLDRVYDPYLSWSGFYAGIVGEAGAPQEKNEWFISERWCVYGYGCDYYRGTADLKTKSWLGGGGITAGYNWQIENVVFGIEGDVTGGYESHKFKYTDYKADGFYAHWTVRPRIGYAVSDWFLPYITAGYSGIYRDLDGKGSDENAFYYAHYQGKLDGTSHGFTAGGGFEFKLSDPVSIKLEGLYDSAIGGPLGRAGINFLF